MKKWAAIAGAVLLLLIIGSCSALAWYLWRPGVREVVVTNRLPQVVEVRFYESYDNTWHTARALDFQLQPDETLNIHARPGDRFLLYPPLGDATVNMGEMHDEITVTRATTTIDVVDVGGPSLESSE